MSNIDSVRGTIRAVQPFSDWPADVIERLCTEAKIQFYEAGEYVYRMNDNPKGIWIVREGWFQVSRTWADGRRAVLDHQQPGQLTGIIPTFDGLPAPFDVIARAPASMVFIPKGMFLDTLMDHPRLMFGIVALMSRRTRLDYARHITHSLHSPRAIIAKTILFMMRGQIRSEAANIDVPVRVPQEDIASLWGMSRQTINREISWFTKNGILARRYRGLTVLDAARLLKVVTDEENLDPYERTIVFPREKALATAM